VRGEVIGERYRLERQLGHGSMAEVWLARDLELERPVALKLLAPDADRARFEREARAAAALSHPNVTRLYDFGEAEGRPYMALEYLPGGTLEERLPAGRPLQDDDTAAIARQLAAALAHAHAHGLVHRDFKPANVLFDASDRPKIADFGIARIGSGSTLTEAGTVLGTAAYISPEQAAGEPATPASDVYSFGVVLFRMLTGRLPFEAESPFELVEMHRRLDAPAVETVRPDAPARLAALAEAALAMDPRERPADGAALTAELGVGPEAAATGATTLVLPRRRVGPHVPRGRTRPVIVLAALLLTAAAGTAGALLLTRDGSSGPGATIPLPTRGVRASTASSSAPTRASTQSTTVAPTTSTAPPATTATPPPTTAPPTTTTAPPTTAATTTATVPAP
jgi:serine/threonine-protein kinase